MLEPKSFTHTLYVWVAWLHLAATTITRTTVTGDQMCSTVLTASWKTWRNLKTAGRQLLQVGANTNVVRQNWIEPYPYNQGLTHIKAYDVVKTRQKVFTSQNCRRCCHTDCGLFWIAEIPSFFACWTAEPAFYQALPFSPFWDTCHKNRVWTSLQLLSQVRIW